MIRKFNHEYYTLNNSCGTKVKVRCWLIDREEMICISDISELKVTRDKIKSQLNSINELISIQSLEPELEDIEETK